MTKKEIKKRCSRCKVRKSPDAFYGDDRKPDQKQSQCAECFKEYRRQHYDEKQKEYLERARINRLKKAYGITVEQWDEMLRQQDGKCALCGKDSKEQKKRFHTDHNHASGQVRAIVCYYCNVHRIGRLNRKWAKALYEYFVKYDKDTNE